LGLRFKIGVFKNLPLLAKKHC